LTCPRTGSLSPWVVGLRGMAAGKGWRREAGRALRAAEDLAAEGWILGYLDTWILGYLDTWILVSCTPSDVFVAETPPAPSGTVTDDDHVGLDEHLTEAELRAFAEARGIELTDEQVQAFLTVTVTVMVTVGDGVDLKESLDSLDETSTP